jgi:hypothetical protein
VHFLCCRNVQEGKVTMQKIEFLVWNGKQHVLMQHDWELDEITVNRAQVIVKLKPKEKLEEKKDRWP